MTTRLGRTGHHPPLTAACIASLVLATTLGLPGAHAAPDHTTPNGSARPAPGATQHSGRALLSGDPVAITTGTVPNIDHPGMHRTPDGVLHVSYTRATSPGYVQAAHTAISPAGQVIRQTDITGPWMFLTASAIVPAPGGMRVVLNGSDALGGPYGKGGAYGAVGDGAGAWTVPTDRLNKYSGDTDAVPLADGTPLSAVLHWSGLYTHAGTFAEDNTDAPPHQQLGAGGAYNVNLEKVGDEVWAAWNVLGQTGSRGTFVQRAHPTVGPVLAAPGSSPAADAVGSSNRSALAASTTGQLYSAYCTGDAEFECTHVSLWNVSTGRVTRISGSADARAITLTAAPEGRMWVTWRSDSAEVTGVRTNRTGSVVGSPTVRRMDDELSFPHTAAESSLGFADVLIHSGGAHRLLRLLPGLTVEATPTRWRAGRPQVVRFRVTDAGDAVRGARVRAGGRSCRTDGAGRCAIRLSVDRPGRVVARVVGSGYAPTTVRLRVRR
jgi:hypothetical protein